jgi:hypothetical protein
MHTKGLQGPGQLWLWHCLGRVPAGGRACRWTHTIMDTRRQGMCAQSLSPHLRCGPGAGIEGATVVSVHGEVQHCWVVLEHFLRTVSVVHVPVYDEHALHPPLQPRHLHTVKKAMDKRKGEEGGGQLRGVREEPRAHQQSFKNQKGGGTKTNSVREANHCKKREGSVPAQPRPRC